MDRPLLYQESIWLNYKRMGSLITNLIEPLGVKRDTVGLLGVVIST